MGNAARAALPTSRHRRRPLVLLAESLPHVGNLARQPSAAPQEGDYWTGGEGNMTARTRAADGDTEAQGFKYIRGRRPEIGLSSFYRIEAVAEALDVSPR